jgi:hypothetical protein
MDAKRIKERLTEQDIIKIVESIGGIFSKEDDVSLIFSTICHHGDSFKLYYYKETKLFHCYSNCGQLGSILDLICESKEYTLSQSIDYICTLLGISKLKQGFSDDSIELISDWSFIKGYKTKNKQKQRETQEFYNKQILNIFQDIYTSEWRDDGISNEVMKAFGIKYSTLQQRIIIPHYNIESNLLGIRGRAMIDEECEKYGKYTPFQIYGTMYNHPLGQNLYGIHINKDIIQKKRKVMLIESEKGVLQCATMFGIENNFALALCGSAKISKTQIKLLLELGVDEVIIGLDRQYEEVNSEEYWNWMKHIREKIAKPLSPYFKVYVLWDTSGLLGYKQSPTDKGKEILLELMKNKIYISAE